MTKKIFWEGPYLTGLDAVVTSVIDNDVTVDQTIFYAQSGGQESDHGTINGYRVMQARRKGTEIVYTLEDGHSLQVGERVRMIIDWDRRYQLMRLHFAAELILELAYQNLQGIEKIGAHIAVDKARIDFLWSEAISRSFPMLEQRAAEIIQANKAIESGISDEGSEQRYWKIEGFAQVPCGGTHLKRTGEIGKIKLKRVNIGKGKERIEIILDDSSVH